MIIKDFRDMVKKINENVNISDLSLKFNKQSFQKYLNDIKNNPTELYWVKRNKFNADIFNDPARNIGIFYKNAYLFFGDNLTVEQVRMPVKKMINGENFENKCIECQKIIKNRTIPCIDCGVLYCFDCMEKIANNQDGKCSKCGCQDNISLDIAIPIIQKKNNN